jgi:UDP-N-acetylglucosamine 2-epimerase (non-hydrolysing)
MSEVIRAHSPDIILAHGDTATLATSLAGFYGGVPIGHVEAGLRTYNMHSPFPEELNRQITSKVAKWHFPPTQTSAENLIKEGVPAEYVHVTGNTVIDALFWALNRLNEDKMKYSLVASALDAQLNFEWKNTKFILITGHRRENFGEGFLQICGALRVLAERYPSIHIVCPVHLNPNVQEPVNITLSGLSNVHLIDPLDYEPFVLLMQSCYLVLTDGGGIQEEAPSLRKPVLVMRDITERLEAVRAGMVKLVGTSQDRIINAVSMLIEDESKYLAMTHGVNPYGDGKASERIINVLRGL